MDIIERDDCPEEFNLARRRLLAGAGVLAASWAVIGATSPGSVLAAPVKGFMRLSTLLIPHKLDPTIGDRLAGAFAKSRKNFASDVDGLLRIADSKNARRVEDFFDDVPQGPLRDTALAIISAWYLGVLEDVPGAKVYAFELALMYGPTSDVMTVPSYAISGPNGWTADAPPFTDMPKF